MDAITALRVVVSLGVVFGAIWFLSRRFRGSSQRAAKRSAPVRVLGKAGVGGKSSVVVVETEGRRLVLGVTEHGISVLHQAEAPEYEEHAEDEAAAGPSEEPKRSFARAMGEASVTPSSAIHGFGTALLDQLRARISR